ncbi:hypothetical protein DH2020_039284 [Rehmannia glutinosa]|uniref:Uncharacterized protein n=1 Tax=Rehmannia glutinosa TaxID=99300 RepID=A0ABR0UWY3_REHGL
MVFDSAPSYGVGLYEDAKARDKHQTLMEDYQELQKVFFFFLIPFSVVGFDFLLLFGRSDTLFAYLLSGSVLDCVICLDDVSWYCCDVGILTDFHLEVDVKRSKLEAGKQRKLMLAAEVRFLRRRYEYFMKSKTLNSLEQEKLVQPPNLVKQNKQSRPRLPPIPETKPKKKHHRKILHGGKEANQHGLSPVADLDRKGRINIRRKTVTRNIAPVLDLNQKERMHANDHTSLRNTTVAFDLNQDNSHSGKDFSMPSRGDEDFQSNVEAVKFEEVKKSLMRCPNDEFQKMLSDLKCCPCGEEKMAGWLH